MGVGLILTSWAGLNAYRHCYTILHAVFAHSMALRARYRVLPRDGSVRTTKL